ncbi:MAG: hypothetical protein K8R79_03645, partial [Calditrichales bacterium]|nr:hypothetical protein [Calditrichales bacterium]
DIPTGRDDIPILKLIADRYIRFNAAHYFFYKKRKSNGTNGNSVCRWIRQFRRAVRNEMEWNEQRG